MKIAYRYGHQPSCQGAVARVNEVVEVRRYGSRVIELLTSNGVECIDCTPNDTSNKNEDLVNGVRKEQTSGAEYFISFHANKAYDNYEGAIGAEVCVYPNSTKGHAMGNRILANLANIGLKNRGCKERGGLYEIKETNACALILEPFFTEASEDVRIYQENFEAFCKAIAEGILGHAIEEPKPSFNPSLNEPYTFTHELKKFTNDEDVVKLKGAMIELGHTYIHSNDWYDEDLVKAITELQTNCGLGVTGDLDQWTVTSINDAVRWIRSQANVVKEEVKVEEPKPVVEQLFDFGEALRHLKNGNKVARNGWNGKGIFIELQTPDFNSKMTHPYIFIDTTGLQTDNTDAPKNRVPWIASQTDMLSVDWKIIK